MTVQLKNKENQLSKLMKNFPNLIKLLKRKINLINQLMKNLPTILIKDMRKKPKDYFENNFESE